MARTRTQPLVAKPVTLQTVVDGATAAWVRRRAAAECIAVSAWVRRLVEREHSAVLAWGGRMVERKRRRKAGRSPRKARSEARR